MIYLAAHGVVFVACYFDRDQRNTLLIFKKNMVQTKIHPATHVLGL